jgi:hypothetical protein
MRGWLSRTQIRQRPMLAVYGGLLVLIAVVVAVMVLNWLGSRSDDRLAVIGNLLSLGTLLLALVAGIVALAAYSAATGQPRLKGKITVSGGIRNLITLNELGSAVDSELMCNIVVENSSSYAARTPAVIVTFHGTSIDASMYVSISGWQPAIRDFYGHEEIWALQWDGGPNYAIHGHSERHLPAFCLKGLRHQPGRPRMSVRLLADGYNRPEINLPIVFALAGPGEYGETIPPPFL